jgi:PhnB protein
MGKIGHAEVRVGDAVVMAFGDRVGRLRDPFGNLWWIQTRLEDLDGAEIMRRAQLPEYIEAMNYVQSSDLANGRP